MKKFSIILMSSILICTSACHKKQTQQWTSLAEAKTITISSLVSGQVNQLNLQEGDIIHENDLIAQIDTLVFHYQKQEILSAFQELEAQMNLLDVQYAQAEKDNQYIDQKYSRTESLVNSNASPAQSLDDVENLKDKSLSAMKNIKIQSDVLKAKKAQLQAKLAIIKKTIKDAKIIAPLEGFVSQLYIDQNELAKQGMPFVDITSLNEINTTIYVSEKELSTFKIGDSLHVFIDGEKDSFIAKVTSINSKSEFTPKQILTPDTRTSLVFGVNLQIVNKNFILKDGMPLVVRR